MCRTLSDVSQFFDFFLNPQSTLLFLLSLSSLLTNISIPILASHYFLTISSSLINIRDSSTNAGIKLNYSITLKRPFL